MIYADRASFLPISAANIVTRPAPEQEFAQDRCTDFPGFAPVGRPLSQPCHVGVMTLRTATLSGCLLDAAVWLFVAFATFNSRSDPATSGLDEAAGYIVTALLLITAAPALALTAFGRVPK